jgi:hypothetical protein
MDERGRAGVRLILGLAQMAGAAVGACLLIRTGITDLTLGVVGVTGLLTIASRRFFKGTRLPSDLSDFGPCDPPKQYNDVNRT